MTIVENPTITVTGGVDTHLEFHVAAAVDANGGVLGVETFDTTTGGYRRLVAWLAGFGEIVKVGVEGTGIDGTVCHQGLQFVPDQLDVLTEIARKTRPGGQLTIAVWGRLEDNPWPAALAAATRTVLGDDAAAGMTTVCSLGDPTQLATLLRQAGYDDIAVNTRTHPATHPDVHAAIAGQLQALPSGSITDHLDDHQRTQLASAMSTLLAPYTDANGTLIVPSTSVFASAITT